MGNVGLFANKLIRFDNKAADVPSVYLNNEIARRCRKDRGNKPAHSSHPHGVRGCDHRTDNEPSTDGEHAWNPDMRVCIGHTGEDRVIFQQLLEPAEIYTHRNGQ